MNKNVQLAIIISVAIIIAAGIVTYGLMNANHEKVIVVNNTTTNNNTTEVNTTKVNTTVEKINDDNNKAQDTTTEPLEFNGKTHSQNYAEARASAQSAGCSDEQLNELVAKEERDGGRV